MAEERRLQVAVNPTSRLLEIHETDRPEHWVEIEQTELAGLALDLLKSLQQFMEGREGGAPGAGFSLTPADEEFASVLLGYSMLVTTTLHELEIKQAAPGSLAHLWWRRLLGAQDEFRWVLLEKVQPGAATPEDGARMIVEKLGSARAKGRLGLRRRRR